MNHESYAEQAKTRTIGCAENMALRHELRTKTALSKIFISHSTELSTHIQKKCYEEVKG